MNKKIFTMMACSTLLASCGAWHGGIDTDRSELSSARQHVAAARAAGAETCAPKEMAKAQANLLYAAHELTEGIHPDENEMLINNAIKYADAAVAKCKKAPETIALTGVQFETNSAELTAASVSILDNAVATLKKRGDIRVEVGAHTDSRGKDAYNLDLSQRRAASVMKYLVDHGIAADRLTSKGYGETKPIADNGTAEGRAKNRRVELTVLR